jgi:hypothetical protein
MAMARVLHCLALAHRIARFSAAGQVAIKDRINAITLAPTDDFRRDSDLFGEAVHTAATQRLIGTAMKRGLRPGTRRWNSPQCSLTWTAADSTTASAKAWGASCGRLCPTPPAMRRWVYLPVNFPA